MDLLCKKTLNTICTHLEEFLFAWTLSGSKRVGAALHWTFCPWVWNSLLLYLNTLAVTGGLWEDGVFQDKKTGFLEVYIFK